MMMTLDDFIPENVVKKLEKYDHITVLFRRSDGRHTTQTGIVIRAGFQNIYIERENGYHYRIPVDSIIKI